MADMTHSSPMTSRTPILTAGRFKSGVARLLTSDLVSAAVRALLRNKIRSYGVTFDTTGMPRGIDARLLLRLYEDAEIRFVRKYLARQPMIVELGGSLGVVASHALAVADPAAHMVSVEANPALVSHLEQTLNAHRQPTQAVEVVHAAIMGHDEAVRLTIGDKWYGARVEEGGNVEVRGLRLDSLLAERSIEKYALIADIEGAERHFLWGGENALSGCEAAVLELHGDHPMIRSMMTRLEELGLRVIDQHGPVVACQR